ncbi:ATP-binding protein [Streptomyces sp. NBC_00878]|uniref:ATP-binding protein n=1 Tax=Streptomyces sp. NBC_00878 TaxID=2975854 RepID=UPI0022534ED9|nr:ATP-binding protein [Streptomyces sp. NBC_00878]MCX4908405.1 ATP-binding protein [Streptomyces sp. NBC_00878]
MPYEPGSAWQYDVPTTGSAYLPPDAGYGKALTNQGYGFEVAVADLIDNSIDAGADEVVVHFLRDTNRIATLLIIDNGRGMDDANLDAAMTVGHRREYGDDSLGMYGTGLKAASLSHASSLTMVSRTKRSRAAGRCLTAEGIEDGFRCDTVDPHYAQDLIDRYDGIIEWHGTVVRWDRVRAFETVGRGQSDQYLSKAISRLETHLGLYLHRFLQQGLKVDIAVWDVSSGEEGIGEEVDHIAVEALDPFGYKVPGKAGYPREFTAPVEGAGEVQLAVHVWPAKSKQAGFRQIGALSDRQGFYFYRNDRLVQAGGWNGLRNPESHLVLARIAVDLPSEPNGVMSLDVKKETVTVTPAFTLGIEKAVDTGGNTFHSFLSDAESAYRDGSKRTEIVRKAVTSPGKGLDPRIKRIIKEELPEKPGEEPIDFVWGALADNRFFDLDRENNVLVLNKAFREDFNDGQRGGANDAPVAKTLLYLLLEDCFGLGRWEKTRADRIDYFNGILMASVHAQRERRERYSS